MGLPKYFSTRPTLRPSIASDAAASPLPRGLLLASASILLILFSVNSTHQVRAPEYKHQNAAQKWPNLTLDAQIESIYVDTQENTLFIATDNFDLYKYSTEFKLLSRMRNDPRQPSDDESAPASSQRWTNKLLATALLNRTELLLSCWQARNLTLSCIINKKTDLKSYSSLVWLDTSYKISDQRDRVSFVQEGKSLLLTSSRLEPLTPVDSNNQVAYLPPVGRFELKGVQSRLALKQRSVLSYRSQLDDNYLTYDYVYTFDYKEHTHFILNDIRKPKQESQGATEYDVRIGRICQKDEDLLSYTEISMICNNMKTTEPMQAKAAFFDANKSALHIAFEPIRNDKFSIKKTSLKSYMCSYSLELITNQFTGAISDCHNNKAGRTFLLSKLQPDNITTPIKCLTNLNPNWCSTKFNSYIDGTSSGYKAAEDNAIDLESMTGINFVYSETQGKESKEVYFVGTEMGLLTKLSSAEDFLFTIDVSNMKVRHYKSETERFSSTPDYTDRGISKYATWRRKIYVNTNRNIVSSLDIDSCQYYDTCHTCILFSSKDPLGCVWCGNECTRDLDCPIDQASSSTCPPMITRVYPTKLPLNHSSILTIEGEGFGSSRGQTIVKLDDQECEIDREISTSEVINCKTRPAKQAKSISLVLSVADDTGVVYFNGTQKVEDELSLVEVKVFGVQPAVGTEESKIILYGENLDAGRNLTILVGAAECKILLKATDSVSCFPRQPNKPNLNSSLGTTVPIKVSVDGHYLVMDHRATFMGISLSPNFTFLGTSQPEGMTINYDKEDTSGMTYLAVIFVTAFLVVIYLASYEHLPRWRLPTFLRHNSKQSEPPKVSFRNPQSSKFTNSHPNANRASDSLNGLVKLNGSTMSSDYFGKPAAIEQDQPLMSSTLDDEMMTLLAQEKILVDRNQLTLGHVLGSGQFGRVYKGFLRNIQTGEHVAVAVKTLHSRCAWEDTVDNRAFLDEGLMMRDFRHENVLALIGVTFDSNGLPMVITPFMLYGDLRSFISDEASSPTVKELIEFGTQVAEGMAYLSSLRFVHRDLAARNCMLDENMIVKVADFGLSRDIYERDYYSSDNRKAKLPVKWMAIESLEKSIYSTKSDVWSYGVLLWELMTRGVVPYPDVDNFDLFSYLKEGRRMLRPRYCPKILYNIMLSCWNEIPSNRPTFDELVVKVSDVINLLKASKDDREDQKVSRDETYCDVHR